MKNILIVLSLLSTSFFALSAHHEESETATKVQENNFAYLSSYTMPAGSNADRMADSLKKDVDSLEKGGYNTCGLLRHQFGGDRAFYSYCFFDSWEQFAEINDSNEPAARASRQLYGDHSDHLVAVTEKNLTKMTPYVLMASYTFGPYLTDNEKRANAKVLFSAFDTAFGGCNMMEHFFGPEQAWYFVCGYDSYADFANKVKAIGDIHENELADMKLDILEHTDDLMIRVK